MEKFLLIIVLTEVIEIEVEADEYDIAVDNVRNMSPMKIVELGDRVQITKDILR